MKRLITGGILIALCAAAAVCAVQGWRLVRTEARARDRMLRLASDAGRRQELVNWVDANLSTRPEYSSICRRSTGGVGMVSVLLPFDWRRLGFDPEHAEIQLVGFSRKYEAAYFTEGKRSGILVAFSGSAGELTAYVKKGRVAAEYGRVTVLCEED